MTGTWPPGPAEGGHAGVRLLGDLRAEIARADGKASVLVAAIGMTVGAFCATLAARDWSPGSLGTIAAVLWWAGVVAVGLALLALLMAVRPRYGGRRWTPGQPLSYFGDIQRAIRYGDLAEALADTERASHPALLKSLAAASEIAARKHQWIRTALAVFCASTVLLPASLLIG